MSDLPVELGIFDGPQRQFSRSMGGNPENREWQSGLRDWLRHGGEDAPPFDEADALAAEELFMGDAMDADDSLGSPVQQTKVSKLPTDPMQPSNLSSRQARLCLPPPASYGSRMQD